MTGNLDLYINQGSTYRRKFTLYDKDDVLLNLDDVDEIQMQIRRTVADPIVIIDVGLNNWIYKEVQEEGIIILDLPPTATSQITIKKAVYDIELHYMDGSVYRILQGNIVVSPEVTR